jgi:AraC-like DNA-binding protein
LPNDDFFVATITSGRGKMSQGGRETNPVAGDVVIYDSARQFEWEFDEDVGMSIARVPRRLLVGRIPEIEQLTARILPAGQPYTSLITSTMQEMVRLPNAIESSHPERLGMAVIDLLSASVECVFLRTEVSLSHDDILKRAKKFLFDNLEDPELELQSAVHALGVSQRTLCRVFAADGTTAIRWLWQQRLDLAFRLLNEGQIKSVSQVAMQCGFSDFSHFGRAFKKAYGVLPKSVLRTPTSLS